MFAASGQARLAYDVDGSGPGADVLMIHAGVTDRRSWHNVTARLRERHRCVAFDVRGFGETEYAPQDGWSPAEDAVAVMDAAGLARPVVVACSLGGRMAVDLALAHPTRVAGLALIGTGIAGAPGPADAPPAAEAALAERYGAAEEAGDLDEINRLEAWLWLDGPLAAEGRVAGAPRELMLAMNRRALAAADPGEPVELDPPAWDRLEQIAVPVLMLVGRLDAHYIQAIAEPAAARLPKAQLVWRDDVAHLPHLEGDPATLQALTTFVDGFPANPSP